MSATVAGPAENGPKPAFRASLAGLVSATLADIGSGARLPPPIFSSESKLKAIQPLVLRPLFSGEKGVVKGVYRSFQLASLHDQYTKDPPSKKSQKNKYNQTSKQTTHAAEEATPGVSLRPYTHNCLLFRLYVAFEISSRHSPRMRARRRRSGPRWRRRRR